MKHMLALTLLLSLLLCPLGHAGEKERANKFYKKMMSKKGTIHITMKDERCPDMTWIFSDPAEVICVTWTDEAIKFFTPKKVGR
jgi:hypothetical protein